MSKPKKSWQEKLEDSKGFPQVSPITAAQTKRWGTGTFVIPAPLEVDGLMREVGFGLLTTVEHIRRALARRHHATIACPLTTGIFAWIAAHAAEERQQTGGNDHTPYWRTLKNNGELNPKYPGGIASLKQKLEHEGHTVVQKRKRFFVPDYHDHLATLS
jgi:hypothetical protein